MINLTIPQQADPGLKPAITVIGVGGAGGNAVNNMIADNLQGVEFVVANTDAQSLSLARTDRRIQLGETTTQGLGAGAKPEIGHAAAEETLDQLAAQIEGSNMVFITAGMGGGTGTGAAPVVARVAREMGILTVGVVTKPFQFEGAHRMRLAETGIEQLSQYVDTLIIIPNQNLFRVANEKTTFADAFKMADDVLNAGVRSITDLMIMPGLINLDFADVRTVMSDMGRAMMGTGEASGERRALDAAEAAIANPLLEDTCMRGAKGVLINITGGPDITLFEVDEAANRIRDEVEGEAHIIFGSCFDPELEGKMRVSVVATGIAGAATMAHPTITQQTTQARAYEVKSSAPAAPAPQAAPTVAQAPAYQAPVQAPVEAPVQEAIAEPAPAVAYTEAPVEAQAPVEAPVQAAAPVQAPVQAAAPAYTPAPQQPQLAPRPAAQTTAQAATAQRPSFSSRPAPVYPQSPTVAHAQSFGTAQATAAAVVREPMLDIDAPQPVARKTSDAFIPPQAADRETAPLRDIPAPRPQAFAAPVQREAARGPLAADRPAATTTTAQPARPASKAGFFNRLTAKLTGDEVAQPQGQVEQHPAAAQPAAPTPAPQARVEEDELEIPAFLRRQAN